MMSGENFVLENFQKMYEPLLQCIESITSTDASNSNSFIQASGLLKSKTNYTFIASFHTIKYLFGFKHRWNLTLPCSECYILKAFQIISSVKQVLQNVGSNIDETYASVYASVTTMARLAGLEDLAVPRKCGPQTTWNIPASTANEHFKTSIFIPYFDCFLPEFNSRFTTLASQAVLALNIIPAHVEHPTIQTISSIYDRFDTDLDSTKTSFEQEATVSKAHWTWSKEKPITIKEKLHHPSSCIQMFPSAIKVLQLFLLTSISSASVKRSNSSLLFVKTIMRSSIGEDRFNALILLYEQKNIELNIEEIINTSAKNTLERCFI